MKLRNYTVFVTPTDNARPRTVKTVAATPSGAQILARDMMLKEGVVMIRPKFTIREERIG